MKDSYQGWELYRTFHTDYNNGTIAEPEVSEDDELWAWLRDEMSLIADEDVTWLFDLYHIPLAEEGKTTLNKVH